MTTFQDRRRLEHVQGYALPDGLSTHAGERSAGEDRCRCAGPELPLIETSYLKETQGEKQREGGS